MLIRALGGVSGTIGVAVMLTANQSMSLSSNNDMDTSFLVGLLLGSVFLAAAVYAGIMARKHRASPYVEGIKAACLMCALAGALIMGLTIEASSYKKRFEQLAKMFSEAYQRSYDDYVRHSRSDPQVKDDLHGNKLLWCRYDGKNGALDVLVPNHVPQSMRRYLATRRAEADFVVVEHIESNGTVIAAFHTVTTNLKAMHFVPYKSVRKTDVLIPGPGGGVVFVDEKVGPLGLKHRVQQMRDEESITDYIKQTVLK